MGDYNNPTNLREMHFKMILDCCGATEWACTTTQRMVQGWDYVIPGEIWDAPPNMVMDDFGFKHNMKMKQLLRNYRNPASIAKGREIILARRAHNDGYTSIGVSMLGEEKKRSNQGHCMRSINFAFPGKKSRESHFRMFVDVFYRMNELTRRWPSDVLFLRTHLIPEILEGFDNYKLISVRCHFSVISVHCQFISPMLGNLEDPYDFLEELRGRDSRHHHRIVLHTARLFRHIDSGKEITFMQVKRPMMKFKRLLDEGTINDQDMRDYINQFLKPEKKI